MIYKLFAIVCFILFRASVVSTQTSECNTSTSALHTKKVLEISDSEKQELNRCALALYNRGLILDEVYCLHDSALLQLQNALPIWYYLEDTLNQANLLKSMGYIYGKIGHFALGKNQIRQAVKIFEKKREENGIAYSHFNLARVFSLEGKIDSAVHYTVAAKSYLENHIDPSSQIVFNNYLLHLAALKVVEIDYEKLIRENQACIIRDGIHDFDELDFLYVVAQVHSSVGNAEQYQIFIQRYEKKCIETGELIDIIQYARYDPRYCP